jgi:hypothetical protein
MKFVLLLLVTALLGQTASDPQEVLGRARAKLQPKLRNLSRYVCIETIERRYFQPSQQAAPSCAQVRAVKTTVGDVGKLESTDRLRLEVTVSAGREIYSWPGATRFDSRDVDEIIRQGPIGTGSFATHLSGIFDNPGVEFHFTGERILGLRSMLEYRFQVPLQASHYRIKAGATWQHLAYQGSFLLDTETLDLQRLTFRVDDVPAGTSICDVDAQLDYQNVHIGEGDALLPSEGQLRIAFEDSRHSNNVTTFSDCREYQTESALLFEDDPQVVRTATSRIMWTPIALPIGLPITLALVSPIDTETAAAGDLVSAKVVQAVRRSDSNVTLIPAGAIVRGRITRVEHHMIPTPYFLIAMSFNRLVLQEGSSPFAARFEGNVELAKELGANLFGQGQGMGFWDVGTFLFRTGKSRYVIPAGFESKWLTLATRGR